MPDPKLQAPSSKLQLSQTNNPPNPTTVMANPTVRSRRPFHYPDEDASSDDDDTPSIMDEQGSPPPFPPSLRPPSLRPPPHPPALPPGRTN